MATPAQIAANLRNAQLSTGPKSEEGKARSAMNALKSLLDAKAPIIPGESPEAFAQLKDEHYGQYAPTDPEQRFYLDTRSLAPGSGPWVGPATNLPLGACRPLL